MVAFLRLKGWARGHHLHHKLHTSSCAAASELNMAPDLPGQLGQLLPPIELHLLSRFGFMPYFGSTAMAVYIPSAIISPSQISMAVLVHNFSVQAFDSSHATGSSRHSNSTKQGLINSTPSPTDSLQSS